MDHDSYQAGRSGQAPGPNTDVAAYQSGQADRAREEAAQQSAGEKRTDRPSLENGVRVTFPKNRL